MNSHDSQNDSATRSLIAEIIDQLSAMSFIRLEEIPNIDLYMDQVTSFMDSHLKATRRFDGDKLLTKTMINNYTKNKLLPPPEKKKYSREHLLSLILIYYMKGFLSLDDIKALLAPVNARYFHTEESLNLEQIYKELTDISPEYIRHIQSDLKNTYETSRQTFREEAPEDQEFLRNFTFISMLCLDIYLRRQVIERLIDGWTPQE